MYSFYKFKDYDSYTKKAMVNAILLLILIGGLILATLYVTFIYEKMMIVLTFLVSLYFLYLFVDFYRTYHDKYCTLSQQLTESEKDEIEFDIKNAHQFSHRLVVSEKYLYCLQSQYALLLRIPLKDIETAEYKGKAYRRDPFLYLTIAGELYLLPYLHTSDTNDSLLLTLLEEYRKGE